MNSSWKRRASRRVAPLLLTLGFFGVALLSPLRPAEAATTCGAALSEAGGSHKRCVSSTGVFHVWTPPGYAPASTSHVVVYAHGWSDQCAKPSAQDANDGVPDTWYNTPGAVYIDAAWTSHNLASQFSGSGLTNALFVAIQAPTCGPTTTAKDPAHVDRTVRWRTFDDLLTELQQAGFGSFNVPIVIMGHSGAYAHLNEWQNDNAKINHVIHLDTFYGSTGSPPVSSFRSWLQDDKHTSSIIATSETSSQSKSVVGALKGALSLPSIPGTLDDAARRTRVLYIDSNVTHMQIVTQGRVIPMLLQRVPLAGTTAPPAPPTPPAPTPGGTTGTTGGPTGTTPPPTELRPVLEIPIPNLEFTGLIREEGKITVPWLAQYVGGVYTFLLSIAGLMAAVMMVVGGFQYVTAAGDNAKLGAGKKRIMNALTGLVLALSSYVILYTINPDLVAFNGLQVFTVKTASLEIFPAAYTPPGEKPLEPAGLPVVTGSGGSACRKTWTGGPTWCNSKETCKKICGEFCEITDTSATKCRQADMWDCGPGIMTAADPLLIPASRWPAMKNVKPSSGAKATVAAINGLVAADRYIESRYKDSMRIFVNSCWRDVWLDIPRDCNTIIRTGSPGLGANPGANPHSSGLACDMTLYEIIPGTTNGKRINAGGQEMNLLQYKRGMEIMDEILTNPSVGGRRLEFEAWHYEWGKPITVCRCGSPTECARARPPRCYNGKPPGAYVGPTDESRWKFPTTDLKKIGFTF